MENLYDVIVIGGGPAGLTAALYLARARYRVLVMEKERFGGQIAISSEVVNYPGVAKTSGAALADTMRQQAEAFGAEFLLAEATSLEADAQVKVVHTRQGDYRCLGLLLATGAHPRTVGFEGEEAFKGHGVAYCATCDGEFFTGKDVFVIGGGYAAAEESVFLTKFARHVTILIRGDDFTCAAAVAEQARSHEKITVLTNTVLEQVSGDGTGLHTARYRNTATDETTVYTAAPGESFGVFVLAGYAPATQLVKGAVALDGHGYIVTDASGKTSLEGVYAAGDVCIKPLRQVVTATSDGALAATALEKYAAAVQRSTGLRPQAPIRRQPTPADPPPPEGDALFTPESRQQLAELFARMASPLQLHLHLDKRPLSQELEHFVTTLADMTDKLTVSTEAQAAADAPFVSIHTADGADTGLAFHGVPSGHEFTSFVLALYNAAGPGQPLSDSLRQQIAALANPTDLKVLVTLSCTMCPELVVAAQRLAAENQRITAHVYDIRHFPHLKERYSVMSVPCLVINGSKTVFGKKNLEELLQLLQ